MPLAATDICHETRAICEAHKLNESIVASVCVSRAKGKYHILAQLCVNANSIAIYQLQ